MQSSYGLAEPVTDEAATIRFVADFGSLPAGTVLTFPAAGNENGRTFLPVRATSGTVVAVDAHGRPAIVVTEHGAGRAVLSTYPLEYFASVRARSNPEETWRLYDALAQVADVERDVRLDDPRVFVDTLVHDDGRRFAVFVSQHATAVTVRPEVAGELRTLAGEPAAELALGPYGVAVRELVLD
jgi:beta-glucosidase